MTDYLHDRKFPIAGPIARWSLRTLTVATLIGLYEFNTQVRNHFVGSCANIADDAQDIGITELVIRSWKA